MSMLRNRVAKRLPQHAQPVSGRSETVTLSPGCVQLQIIVWDELIIFQTEAFLKPVFNLFFP